MWDELQSEADRIKAHYEYVLSTSESLTRMEFLRAACTYCACTTGWRVTHHFQTQSLCREIWFHAPCTCWLFSAILSRVQGKWNNPFPFSFGSIHNCWAKTNWLSKFLLLRCRSLSLLPPPSLHVMISISSCPSLPLTVSPRPPWGVSTKAQLIAFHTWRAAERERERTNPRGVEKGRSLCYADTLINTPPSLHLSHIPLFLFFFTASSVKAAPLLRCKYLSLAVAESAESLQRTEGKRNDENELHAGWDGELDGGCQMRRTFSPSHLHTWASSVRILEVRCGESKFVNLPWHSLYINSKIVEYLPTLTFSPSPESDSECRGYDE